MARGVKNTDPMRKGEYVQDDRGNVFAVLRPAADSEIVVESVVTKQVFTAPVADLKPWDGR